MDKYYTLSPCPIPFTIHIPSPTPPHQFNHQQKYWVPLPQKNHWRSSGHWCDFQIAWNADPAKDNALGAVTGVIEWLPLVPSEILAFTTWDWSFIPLSAGVLYIPDHPRWLALGFLNHQQYQFNINMTNQIDQYNTYISTIQSHLDITGEGCEVAHPISSHVFSISSCLINTFCKIID